MAPRCKTYRENELFHAAPYIKVLKGDRDDTNVIAHKRCVQEDAADRD